MLYNGQIVKTPEYVVELARELRQNLTASEQIIWDRLKNKQLQGFRFRCQHPVHRYILDFYCHETKLAIEIDGDVHQNRAEYDRCRDDFFKAIGITTLRFPAADVMSQSDEVINKILQASLQRSA